MLDQSFSAKNFEVIHNLECRKGNVGLDDMPEAYQLVVREYHETRETLRALILMILKQKEPTEPFPKDADCKELIKHFEELRESLIQYSQNMHFSHDKQ